MEDGGSGNLEFSAPLYRQALLLSASPARRNLLFSNPAIQFLFHFRIRQEQREFPLQRSYDRLC